MELTRFSGHLILCFEGVHDAQKPTAVPTRISGANGRAREGRRNPAELAREFRCSVQTIRNWVGQAAADAVKPRGSREVLPTAEREELAHLRRQLRQLQMERDILAKATAWFATKNGSSSNS
jgi:transposase